MDFIMSHDDPSEIFVAQFMDTLNPKEQAALSLLMQGFREYEIARRMSIFRDEVAEMVQELEKKAALYFGIKRGSEGKGLQKNSMPQKSNTWIFGQKDLPFPALLSALVWETQLYTSARRAGGLLNTRRRTYLSKKLQHLLWIMNLTV